MEVPCLRCEKEEMFQKEIWKRRHEEENCLQKEVCRQVKQRRRLLALLLAGAIATASFTGALALTEEHVKDSTTAQSNRGGGRHRNGPADFIRG